MRGQLVMVKSFTGPLVRRVWDATDSAVIAVPEEIFAKLQGGEEIDLVGFPPQDVYLMKGNEVPSKPNWDDMQHFKVK